MDVIRVVYITFLDRRISIEILYKIDIGKLLIKNINVKEKSLTANSNIRIYRSIECFNEYKL